MMEVSSGYYRTKDGEWGIVYLDHILLGNRELIELVLPKSIPEDTKSNVIHCQSNLLTELVIPEGIKTVYCSSNRLTKLELSDSVGFLACRHNNIKELVVPKSVRRVLCDINTELIPKTEFNENIIIQRYV